MAIDWSLGSLTALTETRSIEASMAVLAALTETRGVEWSMGGLAGLSSDEADPPPEERPARNLNFMSFAP